MEEKGQKDRKNKKNKDGKTEEIVIKIEKIYDDVQIPSYAHKGDAGLDIYAYEGVCLQPLERKLVKTGMRIALPPGYEAQIRPRSGLAIKHGLSVLNTPGTIDSGYRGEVGVILVNLSNEIYEVKKGERIAQMVINKVEQARVELVEKVDETERGDGGFGRSGKF